MPDAVRIAWFTPLRPVASGVSNYNEEILGVLGRTWPIDVFVDGYQPTEFSFSESLGIYAARDFYRRDKRHNYATVVYQFGNSPAHAYMYDVALRRPGVVVLHDTMLQHLHLSLIGRRGGSARYRHEMHKRYGEDGLHVAEQVLRGHVPVSLFDYPLIEELVECSQHVVVHSEFARSVVLDLVPGARVSVVPMGIRLPPVIARDVARSALDIDLNVFLVASVTMVNPHKRLDMVLLALSRVRRQFPVQLLIAGGVSSSVPLDRWIALYGLGAVVETLGYVDDRTARLVAAASDVLVNLRYPTAGETSASVLRLMAASRPVLVSDTGSFQELPDDAVAKVPVDRFEADTIEAILGAIAERGDLANRLGQNARQFIERQHTLNEMSAGYARVLHDELRLSLPLPMMVDCTEPVPLDAAPHERATNALIDSAAIAVLELGLSGHRRLLDEVATAITELGLGPAKIMHDDQTENITEEREHEYD